LVVQGGYVSQSHGQQLSVTKKSNALDKPKPNILNKSAAKLDNKNQNGSSNNNINNNNDDDTSEHDSKHKFVEPAPVAPAVPEVTVSF
jgi:hypothetical protein